MPRQAHVPLRTCVVCGRKKSKYTLLRIALDADNRVVPDCHGRAAGRGAYVCSSCLPQLRFTKRVQKAFRHQAKGLAQELLQQLARGQGNANV